MVYYYCRLSNAGISANICLGSIPVLSASHSLDWARSYRIRSRSDVVFIACFFRVRFACRRSSLNSVANVHGFPWYFPRNEMDLDTHSVLKRFGGQGNCDLPDTVKGSALFLTRLLFVLYPVSNLYCYSPCPLLFSHTECQSCFFSRCLIVKKQNLIPRSSSEDSHNGTRYECFPSPMSQYDE